MLLGRPAAERSADRHDDRGGEDERRGVDGEERRRRRADGEHRAAEQRPDEVAGRARRADQRVRARHVLRGARRPAARPPTQARTAPARPTRRRAGRRARAACVAVAAIASETRTPRRGRRRSSTARRSKWSPIQPANGADSNRRDDAREDRGGDPQRRAGLAVDRRDERDVCGRAAAERDEPGESEAARDPHASCSHRRASAAVAVLARLAAELVGVGGEEVVQLVGLPDVVEVVDLRRVRGSLDRRQPRVPDRRRRQPLVAARVVRRVGSRVRPSSAAACRATPRP